MNVLSHDVLGYIHGFIMNIDNVLGQGDLKVINRELESIRNFCNVNKDTRKTCDIIFKKAYKTLIDISFRDIFEDCLEDSELDDNPVILFNAIRQQLYEKLIPEKDWQYNYYLFNDHMRSIQLAIVSCKFIYYDNMDDILHQAIYIPDEELNVLLQGPLHEFVSYFTNMNLPGIIAEYIEFILYNNNWEKFINYCIDGNERRAYTMMQKWIDRLTRVTCDARLHEEIKNAAMDIIHYHIYNIEGGYVYPSDVNMSPNNRFNGL